MLTHDLGRKNFGKAENAGNVMTPDEVNSLLNDWVKNERLRQHMAQVGTLMYQWATEKLSLPGEEAWKWQMAGLLHDADWDQWPDQHCKKIIEFLEEKNIDPAVIRAIASHGPSFFGVDPETSMDKMLYAFDELSGLIHAYSLMRPDGYTGMELKGVKKRLKEKSFAANVSREDINDASFRSGISTDELISFIIAHQH